MASAFPTLSRKPDKASFTEELYKPQIRTEFEGGYVQSRPRATRSRRRWSLTYTALPDADYQSIVTHFDSAVGDTFDWTHPITSTVYTVRYSGDTLKARRSKGVDRWDLTIKIEEA